VYHHIKTTEIIKTVDIIIIVDKDVMNKRSDIATISKPIRIQKT